MEELRAVEQDFEKALVSADTVRLGELLDERLQMITPLGSVMSKADLIGLMDAGLLQFQGLDLQDLQVRQMGGSAVVTGRAHMRASMGEQKFEAQTRYTHVYEKQGAQWKMVVAQGTQIQQ